MTLRAPFPYPGGKRKASDLVWAALGNPRVYVEPFAGSLAVLLARPGEPAIETVNDADGLLCNVWRALKLHPDETATHADYPVSEIDLHARHRALVAEARKGDLAKRLDADPDYCEPRLAGWWIWGASQWIGGGWCADRTAPKRQKPGVHHDRGVNANASAEPWRKKPESYGRVQGKGTHGDAAFTPPRRRPSTTTAGSGTQRPSVISTWIQRPHLTTAGNGVHSLGVQRQIPQAHGIGGTGVHGHRVGESGGIHAWFEALAARLRRVRILSGDFERTLTHSTLYVEGSNVAGVFLDPPYAHDLRSTNLYAHDGADVSERACKWAVANGNNPKLRIVLAGLEGEHDMPSTWRKIAWKGHFGLGRSEGNVNRHLERLWLSPHCEHARTQLELELETTP